jgi:hypothetical protein
LKPAQANSSRDPILKKPFKKKKREGEWWLSIKLVIFAKGGGID